MYDELSLNIAVITSTKIAKISFCTASALELTALSASILRFALAVQAFSVTSYDWSSKIFFFDIVKYLFYSELNSVKAHDREVTQQAKHAQEEVQ